MTKNQLVRLGRKKRVRRASCPALEGCPQKRGVCIKVYTTKPKKPNSANRKVVKVRLSTGRELIVYVPYEGHSLQEHSTVLIQGRGPQDLPGVSYAAVRGTRDLAGVDKRRKGRSKAGVKRPKTSK